MNVKLNFVIFVFTNELSKTSTGAFYYNHQLHGKQLKRHKFVLVNRCHYNLSFHDFSLCIKLIYCLLSDFGTVQFAIFCKCKFKVINDVKKDVPQ